MAVCKRIKNGKTVWGFSTYYTTPFGEKVRKQKFSVDWTRKQASEAERAFLNDVQHNSATLTYGELFDLCIGFKSPLLKESTVKIYRDHHKNRILPFFGDMKVSEITPLQITEWQKRLLKMRVDSHPYSNNILKATQMCFSMVLTWGAQHGYIAQNPFKVPMVKRQEYKEPLEVYDDDTFAKFLEVIDDPTYEAFFLTLFNTGMRKGEAIALLTSDYDGYGLRINKTWNKDLQKATPPKTHNSNRYVKLNKETRDAIDELIENYPPGEMVLFGCNTHLSVTTMERKKTEWMKLADVPYLNTHGFRHSFVTKLIQKGRRSAEEVAKIVGDTTDTVIKTYSHLFPDQTDQVVDFLDETPHRKRHQKRHQNFENISVNSSENDGKSTENVHIMA